MGLFDRWLGDPMEKGERLLASGDARGALAAFERASPSVKRDHLVADARALVVRNLVTKADAAEADGHLEDAADWLRAALEEIDAAGDEDRTQLGDGLRARVGDLDSRIEEAAEARDREAYGLEVGSAAQGPEFELGDEALWDALVGMLRPGVARRYLAAGDVFEKACVLLHGGNVAAALDTLVMLGDNGVVLLERGRAHLLAGDAAAAARDLDAAWEMLGDQPVDLASSWSVPQLWAEAALEAGHASEVSARLEPLVDIDRMDLAEVYGRALLASGAAPEAARFLTDMLAYAPSPPLVRLLAEAAEAAGDADAGLAVLEESIAASCAGGSCGKTPLDTLNVHMLVERYLTRGQAADLERCRELLGQSIAQRGGRVGAVDCRLMARYLRAIGDDERAAEAEAAAAGAGGGEVVAESLAAGLGGGAGRAIL